MASTISGSIEAENSRQGVEITTSAQVFASILPRLLSNSSPRIVVEGRPLGESKHFDESITVEINTKKVELAPQHIAETRDLGYPKTHYNDTPFEEVETLNPVNYVRDESWETRYPVVLDAASFTDPGTLDGAIEPLTIRAVASRQAIEGSAAARGVKGKIEGYADDALGLSNPIEQRQYYEGYQGSTRPYLEYGDTLQRPIPVKIDYFHDEPRNPSPHLDTDDAGLVASYVSDDQLAAIVGAASGSFQKFGYSYRSAGAGWTVKDTENGTDSITFLDRLSSSGSLAPRSNVTRVVRQVSTLNVGFQDSDAVSKVAPFDANRVIENNQLYYPGNSSTSPLVSGGKTQDISITAKPNIIQRSVRTITDDITSPGFFDTLTKDDLLLPDGTYGKSVIRINVSSISSSAELGSNVSGSNLAYAGRIDSKMAKVAIKSIHDEETFNGSLFLSSAFRNTVNAINLEYKATGIAGTGFLYYSPTRRAWIEKRSDHSTSLKTNDFNSDRDGAFNSIEVNTWPHGTGTNPFRYETDAEGREGDAALPNDDFAPSNARAVTRIARRDTSGGATSNWYSTVMQISGTNETLAQFTASPQLGYFLPYREHQETLGYKNIGSPTTVFGAPFAPKYHAFDDETIKLSDYIDRPFLLRKVIIKVPVEIQRRHDYVSSSYTVALGGNSAPLWTKDVTARRDIDNYTFFLYRQRRTKQPDVPRDSVQDISSSVRFLIASASLCVYNSPTFGRAYSNGFYNYFGNSTPVYQSRPGSAIKAEYLDALTSYMFGTDTDPITTSPLTRNSGTLHNPSVSIDTNMPIENGLRSVRYLGRGGIKLNAYPSVVGGGWPNPSLTYVTSSTAHFSTSFYVEKPSSPSTYTDTGDTNRLFNRYPYTGSFTNITDPDHHPPITTINQHFWFGSTRQPVFNTNAFPNTDYSGSALSAGIGPYATFYRDDPYFVTSESLEFTKNYRDPTFDIEIGRVGFSIFNNTSEKPFESTLGILYDGRSVPNFFGRDSRPNLAATMQRSSLIEFYNADSENAISYNANFTVGSMSGSSMAELIASLTVGYAPSSTISHTLRNYLLMPEDELVLGLDAGVTPPPDIAPLQGKPMPDADPSINTDFRDTSAGAAQIAAKISAARRRQRRIQQERRERRRDRAIDRAAENISAGGVALAAAAASGTGAVGWSGAGLTGTSTDYDPDAAAAVTQGIGPDKSGEENFGAKAEYSDDGGTYTAPTGAGFASLGDSQRVDEVTGNFTDANAILPV